MSPYRGSAGRTEEWRHLRVERADGVVTVTLDRPDKLNALTFGAYADLRDLLTELPHHGDTRVLVLAGDAAGASAPAGTSTRSSAPPSPWAPDNCWTSPA